MSRQLWERPVADQPLVLSHEHQLQLDRLATTEIPQFAIEPLWKPEVTQATQEERIREVLALAAQVPLYASLFRKAKVRPQDFKTLSDIRRFPIVTKQDLINAYRENCVHPSYLGRKTYPTWSSGSSGLTLQIEFDPQAVIVDTMQGVVQLLLQGDGKIGPNDITANYYTCPWWTDNIGGQWRSAFVSSLVSPGEAAKFFRHVRPSVLAGYPSLLQRLADTLEPRELPLRLVVTNSEQSSRLERDQLAAHFGCPVLDEYSSEELTRIAVELPDGKYYLNESAVFLEVLDPETREPVADGDWGEAVATSLLNKAMPFIRYATGDIVKRPKDLSSRWKDIGWGQLGAIGGRMFDSFLRPDGKLVPSGVMLDVIYRAFGDIGVCVDQFELVQVCQTKAQLNVRPARGATNATVDAFAERVRELLAFVLEASVTLSVGSYTAAVKSGKSKRRPVRRSFDC